mmetsp:Transcript_80361/g.239373  ORF Transcript_80361/g.239373 Transcript_80361/m.239373 type:complete len:273 (-) Transcript_80361:755-1573(-)
MQWRVPPVGGRGCTAPRNRGPGASRSCNAGQAAAAKDTAPSGESRPWQRARPSTRKRLPCDRPIDSTLPGPRATWPLSSRASRWGRPASSAPTCSSRSRKAATHGLWRSCARVASESSRRPLGSVEAASLGCAVSMCSRSREPPTPPSSPQHRLGQYSAPESNGSRLSSRSLPTSSRGHCRGGVSRVLFSPLIASSRSAGKQLKAAKVGSDTPRHSRRSTRTTWPSNGALARTAISSASRKEWSTRCCSARSGCHRPASSRSAGSKRDSPLV